MSRNDRDSPGIFAFVPVVSRLTQKADNVPDFSQTLSSRAHRWHLFLNKKLISLVEAKKVAFATVLSTERFVISIFRRGIIARHAPRFRKRGVVNDFCARETQIYQLSRLSDLETWHLCGSHPETVAIYNDQRKYIYLLLYMLQQCKAYLGIIGRKRFFAGTVGPYSTYHRPISSRHARFIARKELM